jgi:phosphatidylcholine synthase
MPPRKSVSASEKPVTAKVSALGRVVGLSIHVFTAAGAAAGLMALASAFKAQFPAMFFWLAVALVIDGIDGTFARLARVTETAPEYDGAVLDLIVDYLNYVLVPAIAIWRSGLMADDLALGLGILITVTSSLYFADRRMKLPDHFFRGFPALWNVVALYLFVFRLPSWASAGVILLLCVLMFLPVPFLHPMRVRRMQAMSIAFTVLWLGSAGLAVTQGLNTDMFAKGGLIVSALYFVLASVLRARVR